jgi:hypothetical protein
MTNGPIVPRFGHIKIAVAAPEFLNIKCSVFAGTNDVLVPDPVPRSQSARTNHITIPVLVDDQGLQKLENPGFIFTEKIPLFLLALFQHFI